MSLAGSQLTPSVRNSLDGTLDFQMVGPPSEHGAGQSNHVSLQALEDACLNAIMLGDGCCINDIGALLDDAGFGSFNVSKVMAVTDVRLIRITFKDLRLQLPAYSDFLQTLYRHAGKCLSTRYPELFDHVLPPPDFKWPTTTLVCFEAGSQLVLRNGPCLLVQGRLQREVTSMASRRNGSRSSSRHRRKTTGVVLESFKYLCLTDIQDFLFTVNTPYCKILLSEGASCEVLVAQTPEHSPLASIRSRLDTDATTTSDFESLVDSLATDPAKNEQLFRSNSFQSSLSNMDNLRSYTSAGNGARVTLQLPENTPDGLQKSLKSRLSQPLMSISKQELTAPRKHTHNHTHVRTHTHIHTHTHT